LSELPLPEALKRIEAYARAGVDALMIPGIALKTRPLIEAVHEASALPLCVVGLSQEMAADHDFLAKNRVCVRYFGQPVYGVAVKAIHDCLQHLWEGGALEDLDVLRASPQLLSAITRTDQFVDWDRTYGSESTGT